MIAKTRVSVAVVVSFVLMAMSSPSAAVGQPVSVLADVIQPTSAEFTAYSTEELASAVDTRQRLGFPAQPSYVAVLESSLADVGTEAIGLPLTGAELAEVRRREAIQGLFYETLEGSVRARPDFGGVHIDQPAGGKVVVLTTADAATVAAELHQAEPRLQNNLVVRQVPVTAAELEGAMTRLFDEWMSRFRDVPVFAVSADHRNTALVVEVAHDQVGAARRYAELMSGDLGQIGLRVEAGEPHVGSVCTSRTNCYSPLRPGIRIGSSSTSFSCTMAFHIRLASTGSGHFLTAGHCSGSNWYHQPHGYIGAQTGNFLCDSSGSLDIKRVSMVLAQQSRSVYPGYTVSASAFPVADSTIRGSLGRTNAVRTGIVLYSAMRYNLSGHCAAVGGRHNLTTQGGDSGSPIWQNSPVRAVGVHSSLEGAFGRVQDALNGWNANLY